MPIMMSTGEPLLAVSMAPAMAHSTVTHCYTMLKTLISLGALALHNRPECITGLWALNPITALLKCATTLHSARHSGTDACGCAKRLDIF